MIERLGFVGIALVGTIVALPKVPVFPGQIVAQLITPTPPLVIPAWILGGGNFYGGQQAGTSPCPTECLFYDVDPGATADQSLFAGVIDASAYTDTALESNCPGIGSGGSNVSNCNPYKYINMGILLCEGGLESTAAFNYLNSSDETGFLHTYSTPPPPIQTPAPGNRLTQPGSCASPTPTFTPTNGFLTNPGDLGFQTWLVNHAWRAIPSYFPPPYGILEDNFSVVGWPCSASYEYGDEACNNRGTSASPTPGNWETALGSFESSAAQATCSPKCFAFIGNGLTLGGGSNSGPCIVYTTGHCYVKATPGVTAEGGIIDDKDDLAKFCAATDTAGNLRGIEAEEIVFLKGVGGAPPPVYANTQTIVYMINTMSDLVQYTSGGCKNMVAIDVEAGGGSFYPLDNYTQGTVPGGIPVRMEATALRFLVPNPVTLVPDRMQPLYYTVGGTNNDWSPSSNQCANPSGSFCEVPYFFEETLVPQGPEVTVNTFTYGGVNSVGDGCPYPSPSPTPNDSGGAVDLMVDCVSADSDPGAAVFRQEYEHLYINGTDYGPAAVLLNTASTTRVPIDSSWFSCSGCSPITSFHSKLALAGGELTSVIYGSGTISLPCTQTATPSPNPYCTDQNTVPENTATFEHDHPGNIDAHSGIILLGTSPP